MTTTTSVKPITKLEVIEEPDSIFILKMQSSVHMEPSYKIILAGDYSFDKLFWNSESNSYQTSADSFQIYDLFNSAKQYHFLDSFFNDFHQLVRDNPKAKIYEIETNLSFYEIPGWAK